MAEAQDIFKNRIIGYDTKPADQFLANPLNYRKHPQKQRDAVHASLSELGWIAAVVENVRTGRLIDGHERVWQALEQNEDVPYLQVDLSEEEERLALAVFDPLTSMAETDAAKLDELLQEVSTGEAALQELLSEMADEVGLYSTIVNDPMAEWQGMPEFEQEDNFGAVHSIKVHFASTEDIGAFAELVGQTVTDKMVYIWHPKQEKEDLKQYVVEDEHAT